MTLGIIDGNEQIENFLVLLISVVYIVLVILGKVSTDGFVILATLVIRKLLLGENGNGKDNAGKS